MTLRIAFLGDLMIGRRVEAELARRPPETFWGDLLDELKSADLVVGNLECPITQSSKRWPKPKTWRFKASHKALEILHAGKVAAVNLANNHFGDFCEEGMHDTFAALEAAGIAHFGAGRNLTEAARPAILERKGVKIALKGFSDRMPEFAANDAGPGTHFAWPPKGTGESAKVLAPLNDVPRDLTIVSAHWGADLLAAPLSSRRRFARALIAGGVDVIHGHSSHILHGVEAIEGRPVIYDNGNSLEDFWPYPWVWTKRSSLFVLEIGADASRLRQIPAITHGMTLKRPEGKLARVMEERFARRSRQLGSQPEMKDGELIYPLSLKLAAASRASGAPRNP